MDFTEQNFFKLSCWNEIISLINHHRDSFFKTFHISYPTEFRDMLFIFLFNYLPTGYVRVNYIPHNQAEKLSLQPWHTRELEKKNFNKQNSWPQILSLIY